MDQDKILEKKIRDIAEQVYAQKTLKSKYSVAQVPFHTHNGIDSTRVNEKDIVLNIRNYVRLVADETQSFTIRNIPNVSTIDLQGFAANNADGSPATERAIINGIAKFGRCYNFVGTAPVISATSTVVGIPFIQSSNAFYTAQGMSPTFRVSVAPSLAYVTSGAGDKVNMVINSYNNGEISVTVTLDTNWKLQVDLIFS